MKKRTRPSGAGQWLPRCLSVLMGGFVLGGAARAWAQDEAPSKAICAQAYESSQESRAAGQLQETKRRLSLCAHPECPTFVQKDCARWLDEVERELPSIVIEAEGLEADAAQSVRVQIDGAPVVNALGGSPIPLDPGRHELLAESPGQPSVSRVIVAQQGVQGRTVTLRFAPPEPAPPTSVVAADRGTSGGSTLRPYAYVAWGVGAVGLGAFAVLGTLGRADERGLKDDCPRAALDPADVGPGVCLKATADERKAIYEREFILADVGLVTGLLGLATGTVLFLLSSGEGDAPTSADEAALRVDVAPTPGGGYASVRGAF